MCSTVRRCILVSILAFASTSSFAATFVEDFNDGVLDPRLTASLAPGFTMTFAFGEVELAKSSGTTNGAAIIATNFEVVGDFVATVDASRVDLTSFADLALQSLHPAGSSQFVDIFFNDQTKIIANFFVGPSPNTTIINTSVSPVEFKIERVGQTVTAGYTFNGGFVAVDSDSGPFLAGPAVIRIFLLQNNGFSDSHVGRFDNLMITADAFVRDPPEAPMLSPWGVIAICGVLALAALWALRTQAHHSTGNQHRAHPA
jgi:hypothetical protein